MKIMETIIDADTFAIIISEKSPVSRSYFFLSRNRRILNICQQQNFWWFVIESILTHCDMMCEILLGKLISFPTWLYFEALFASPTHVSSEDMRSNRTTNRYPTIRKAIKYITPTFVNEIFLSLIKRPNIHGSDDVLSHVRTTSSCRPTSHNCEMPHSREKALLWQDTMLSLRYM